MYFKVSILIFIVVSCDYFSKTSAETFPDPIEYTRCSPYYCDNKRFICKEIHCTEDQIQGIQPEKCICCSTCFNKLGK